METQKSSEIALAEIRDFSQLGHLKRRPRCSDGTLDMRYKSNRVLSKHARVTDFYDPADPSKHIDEAVIRQLLADQQEQYDKSRFKDMTLKVQELEREREELQNYKKKAQKLLAFYRKHFDRLWTQNKSQPQD